MVNAVRPRRVLAGIGAGLDQCRHRAAPAFVDGMHDRGPVVDAAPEVGAGAETDQGPDALGPAGARGGDQGRAAVGVLLVDGDAGPHQSFETGQVAAGRGGHQGRVRVADAPGCEQG